MLNGAQRKDLKKKPTLLFLISASIKEDKLLLPVLITAICNTFLLFLELVQLLHK